MVLVNAIMGQTNFASSVWSLNKLPATLETAINARQPDQIKKNYEEER